MFYLANKENEAVNIRFRLLDAPPKLSLWNNADGTVRTLYPDADGLFTLELSPTLSVFFVVGG